MSTLSERPGIGPETNTETIERQELQSRFENILKDKFKEVPPGAVFPSKISDTETISFFAPPKSEDPKNLYVIVGYKEGGMDRHANFSLFNDGTLSGRIPRALEGRVRSEDILREVINDAETLDMDINFWLTVDMEKIFPSGPWPEKERPSRGGGGGGKPNIDRDRLKFLRGQSEALFGFVNGREGGFRGYRGFVFPNFVLLEHPETENAAYFIDIPRIEKNRADISLLDKMNFMRKDWVRELSISRPEHIARRTKRIIHEGRWPVEMQEEIDKRLRQI